MSSCSANGKLSIFGGFGTQLCRLRTRFWPNWVRSRSLRPTAPRTPDPSRGRSRNQRSVDLSTVGHPQDEYEQLTIVDLVDDPIVACAHPPLSCSTYETLGGRGSRFFREQLEHRLDATPDGRVELS